MEDIKVDFGKVAFIKGPSSATADLPNAEPPAMTFGSAQGSKAIEAVLNSSTLLLQRLKSPVEANPLPQGIPLKVLVKNLKREVHHLKRKLEKKWKESLRSPKRITLRPLPKSTISTNPLSNSLECILLRRIN
ncbi:hypothetical protein COCNU_scaffold000959G000010 [Cocos nucifera]|nr:hypothetical protein [Cocos nucifera]